MGNLYRHPIGLVRSTGGLEDSYDLAGHPIGLVEAQVVETTPVVSLVAEAARLSTFSVMTTSFSSYGSIEGLTLLNGRTSWTARRYAYQPFDSRPCNVAYFTRTHVHVYSRNAPEC